MSQGKHIRFRVLIADDDPTVQKVLVSRLERKGHFVKIANNGKEALEIDQHFQCEVLVSDLRMPEMNGFELIEKIEAPAVIITGHGDKESAIRAVEAGAFSFFEKPFDLDALEITVQRAGEKFLLEKERSVLMRRLSKLCKLQDRELENLRHLRVGESLLIGQSPQIKEIKKILTQLAKKPQATLLIQGESGTGKEVVAQELHRLTFRSDSQTPFLAINCATVPKDLLESELFGHEKGAFSGAHQQRIGLAEAVRTGTLFLDEIGDMSAEHQTKILRFLQEKKFKRVGANNELNFRGRVVAASHKNLKKLVEEGKFREDLYYRLNIVTAHLPPLRERPGDIALLAKFLAEKHGCSGIAQLEQMKDYPWPGNVRELNNWIERASILDEVSEEGLVESSVPYSNSPASASAQDDTQPRATHSSEKAPWQDSKLSLHERRQALLEHYDAIWIKEALQENKGVLSRAARELDIDRKNLSKRIKDLEIQIDELKSSNTKKAA